MPDCEYCSASFDDEDSYYAHLGDEHAAELGPIDQRRVDQHTGGSGDEGIPAGPVVLVGVIGFALAVVVYVVFFFGGGSAASEAGPPATINGINVSKTPVNVGESDFHGAINVTIDGERLDFSRERFQLQDSAFHFENGNGAVWHGHADALTLRYAMATLGLNVTDSTVTYDGTTYRDSDPDTTVRVRIDGEDADPSNATLDGVRSVSNADAGDFIHIVVTTNEST
ncbi:hypothetical protein [Halapricum salinum]|uniref:C2H2-type domain-containing protein n=1 Tax=Halapricum salinum TaxID=1457250 RepID=A0A4D6HEC6_9EURY|nr:hypothetical protein [Halapricum salinum]QCC51087.1 hypothetical protein DV733_07435 [Halapricum salinum]